MMHHECLSLVNSSRVQAELAVGGHDSNQYVDRLIAETGFDCCRFAWSALLVPVVTRVEYCRWKIGYPRLLWASA